MKRNKLQDEVFNAFLDSELKVTQIANMLDMRYETVSRTVNDASHCNIRTLDRILHAMGYRLTIEKLTGETINETIN